MKTALLKRLKRLEEFRAVGSQPPVEWQIGYVKKLPQEYTGERHVVTVGRDADGKYRWEERRGAPPANEYGPTSIIKTVLSSSEGWTAGLFLAGGCARMKGVIPDALNAAVLERYSSGLCLNQACLIPLENCYRYCRGF